MNNFFYDNITNKTNENTAYRNVIYTGKMQFVYMNIQPLDNIPKEIHNDHDQFFNIIKGEGIAIINDVEYKLYKNIGLIVPAGFTHQIINTSNCQPLKLYTIYSPPEHKPFTFNENNPDNINIYKIKYIKYKLKYLQLKKNN